MTKRIRVLPLLWLVFAGCAAFAPNSQDPSAPDIGPMTMARMELVFASQVPAIAGPSGAIRTKIDGINIFLISDSTNDRMRMVAPIKVIDRIDLRLFGSLLEANFNDTLDTRYALSEGRIYGVFQHPISSLTPGHIRSALTQVVNMVKTFGTRNSSGKLPHPRPRRDVH